MKKFSDENATKASRYKYPRTPHLPWSPGATKDDVRCINTEIFTGKRVVITEKMDGENTTLYSDVAAQA